MSEGITAEQEEELRQAKLLLERPGIAARVTQIIGEPVEHSLALLPAPVAGFVQEASRRALRRSLLTATRTLGKAPGRAPSNRWHKLAVGITGAVSGYFSAPALLLELPLSTTLMMRSIADVARSQGEDPTDIETRLACISVFALGAGSSRQNASETGYFAVRAGLSKALGDAASHIARRGLTDGGGPILVRFISKVAARFSSVVTQKLAAQAVPVLGAAGGATINLVFMDHFQGVARGHFTIRRLEREHGSNAVRTLYETL